MILELKTAEATFIKDMRGECHFIIDCSCGGKDGKFRGSHYKDCSEENEDVIRSYEPFDLHEKFEHTFYTNDYLFRNILLGEHTMKNQQKPSIIVCNDCEREFPFTLESYLDLTTLLITEYNKEVTRINTLQGTV